MRHNVTLFRPSGKPTSGYLVKVYDFVDDATGYNPLVSAKYNYTDNGDGVYYADITTTFKGTLVITSANGATTVVPPAYKGYLFQGDNQPTIRPS